MKDTLIPALFWFYVAVLPALVVLGTGWVRFLHHGFVRFCLGIIIPFVVTQLYEFTVLAPERIAQMPSYDPDFSDTGAGAAIFLFSFTIPGFVALLTLTIEDVVRSRLRKKKNESHAING